MPICPVCGGDEFSILVPARRIDEECRMRERFIRERLAREPSPGERKDLTEFFHQSGADILICEECSLLSREEHGVRQPAGNYEADEYDPAAMERVYPQYVDAFRAKAEPYRSLLAKGANVIEIGSHYGAFLQIAGEWGWRAQGVDIGKDTSRFAQSKGFEVHVCELAECRFSSGAFDAVFIWNCFEQMEDSKPTLMECRRVLKPGGLLTVRVPNGLFYSMCESLLADESLPRQSAEFLIDAMGYNNLLGFPYRYGHRRSTLERLISGFGFRAEGWLNSELLTLPLPEQPGWVQWEEQTINREVQLRARSVLAQAGTLTGPWIELWFRAT